MPRTARIVIPGYPHHVVQRGHNRQATFERTDDFARYLRSLSELREECEVRVLAWCLMTNHVHLLLVPGRTDSLARLMKRLAGRQTRYHNAQARRTGTLWESRFKSSIVQRDGYLHACSRYIELNPVRAGIVVAPEDYPWSSCRERLGSVEPSLLDDEWCPRSPALADAWREYLHDPLPAAESALIRTGVQRGHLTGSLRFNEEVAAILGRRVELQAQGRPRRPACDRGYSSSK